MTTYSYNKKLPLVLLTLVLLTFGVIALENTFATTVNDSQGTGESLEPGRDFAVLLNYHDGSGYNTSLSTNAPFVETALWAPGKTEILYLAVTNNEAFPVKCTLNMKVSQNDFGRYFAFAAIPQDLKAPGASHPANWPAFEAAAGGSMPLKISSDTVKNPVFDGVILAPGETRHFALGIHMDEATPSDYENKQIAMTFEFHINAESEPGATLLNQ